jgi:hypothetical protein
LMIVSRIVAPTKRSHALRVSLRARIFSASIADIGGDFPFSRLRSPCRGASRSVRDHRPRSHGD